MCAWTLLDLPKAGQGNGTNLHISFSMENERRAASVGIKPTTQYLHTRQILLHVRICSTSCSASFISLAMACSVILRDLGKVCVHACIQYVVLNVCERKMCAHANYTVSCTFCLFIKGV